MRALAPLRRAAHSERGYTMVVAMMVLLVSGLLVTAAFVSAEGDVKLTRTNLSQERAYEAAQAALQVYQYNLNTSALYWETCPKSESPEFRKVPGSTEEEYSYRTLAATGYTQSECETKHRQYMILESKHPATGTFRVEAVGKSGSSTRKIIATLYHPGYLSYVFLSNYEVEDPSTFEGEEPKNCEHYYEERVAKKYTEECPTIPFINEDEINGPFHTNDAVSICNTPIFGRKEFQKTENEDLIEMGEGNYAYTFCTDKPTIYGKYLSGKSVSTILPPETDNELLEAASYTFSGRTFVELKEGTPNKLWVVNAEKPKGEEKEFPANGVIFIKNGKEVATKCRKYSPFDSNASYEEDSECGDVYIKGKYTESLTVGAANDVVIVGSLETSHEASGKPTGTAALGLIADKFVRVFHPVNCNKCTNKLTRGQLEGPCNATNMKAGEGPPKNWGLEALNKTGWGSQKDITVDAAILSTKNSWIVDNFLCPEKSKPEPLGTLTVWGAISQFWRGRVTCDSGADCGYLKSYNYDERLKTDQPPSFLSPASSSGWTIERETRPPG